MRIDDGPLLSVAEGNQGNIMRGRFIIINFVIILSITIF